MIIYPAIDIRGGRCVRLIEGDFNRETAFDADPADAAIRWQAAGAEWIHVVDLDGAVEGHPVNLDAIARICATTTAQIQVGGGLRTVEDVELIFAAGVSRAIIGTAAIGDDALVKALVARFGKRIAVGLDARDGKLAAKGWLEQTEVTALDAARRLRGLGVETVIFTDIGRDGTLTGPNLDALAAMVDVWGSGVIASGGVGSQADLDALPAVGVSGAIVGRALYDGRVDLPTAIQRAGAAK